MWGVPQDKKKTESFHRNMFPGKRCATVHVPYARCTLGVSSGLNGRIAAGVSVDHVEDSMVAGAKRQGRYIGPHVDYQEQRTRGSRIPENGVRAGIILSLVPGPKQASRRWILVYPFGTTQKPPQTS